MIYESFTDFAHFFKWAWLSDPRASMREGGVTKPSWGVVGGMEIANHVEAV